VARGTYQGTGGPTAQTRKIPMLARRHPAAVVVSHAHLDHIGRLPFLPRRGYTGPIFGTAPTFDLGRVIMRDALRLQLGDLERENRRRTRAGQPVLEPLYDDEDRSEEHTSELQSLTNIVCRLLLEKKKNRRSS